MPRAWLDYFTTTAQIAQTALRLRQPPQMSFRGVKRRGNPLNRNVNTVTIANDLACSRNLYRAENLCYQFEHGQNSCHSSARLSAWCPRLWRKRMNENLFRAFLYTECAYLGCEPQRRREIGAPSLMDSTSDCAVLLRSWRTKRSGTAFSRFVLQTLRMPFVACNELAIATKSIASVCPHAERTTWVPSSLRRGGTAVWAALSNTSSECVVAKANEADCIANAEVQTREEWGHFI